MTAMLTEKKVGWLVRFSTLLNKCAFLKVLGDFIVEKCLKKG